MTIRRTIAAKKRPDTPAEIASRVAWIAAGRQAHADAMAKFGGVTADNAREFIEFQELRMKELEERQ
jgi:hypothetical protein